MSDGTDSKRETVTSFGAAADDYLESAVHRQGADLERVADWCSDATQVLDIATGAGHVAGAVAARGVSRVVAADAAPEMAATAESEFDGVEGVIADAEALPFATGAFDAATCRIAAHHFPDPEAFVSEVSRVLEPNGTFAFEDNVAPADDDLDAFINRVERLRDPTHVRSYRTNRWIELLEANEFVVEDVHHVRKTLEFDGWIDAQSVGDDRRGELESILLAAPPEATTAFEIDVEDGQVRSFANHKALIRARRLE
ncbi:methyltransferase domain-containing protein [Natrarchaeobaculum aegyptiacum]|uniref:SAM-dependent methyltransferase n=1 Tax=Natrarchaeobaculum aegyptiacum TaxID=745377 RepID=A0A2Z2HPQ9_9EURY|nr:methyltransferase domain-containing protein [Natrarchaeobaculum aegyptiacum]ARS89029.1 SAM-dependent methyltransferase [Natrarchaeobaculum aegyptiacum]